MKTYNSDLADNDKVELIMCSFDQEKKDALAWAKKETFPWPTVMMKDLKRAGVEKFAGRGVPHYVLVDKEGESLAVGKQQAMEKIKELTK